MSRRSLAKEWANFERLLLDPINASQNDRKMARRFFYAGAQGMINSIMAGIAPGNDDPSDEELAHMERLTEELRTFERHVADGIA